MTQLLEKAFNEASCLSEDEQDKFAEFLLLELKAERWEKQLEEDIKEGKLDSLADQAIKDFNESKCREI